MYKIIYILKSYTECHLQILLHKFQYFCMIFKIIKCQSEKHLLLKSVYSCLSAPAHTHRSIQLKKSTV